MISSLFLIKLIMQQIQIIGNLGEDCQIREFNGNKFVSFRVACTRRVHTQQGDQDQTTWYSCTYNNFRAGVVPYLKKGTKVYVQGVPSFVLYDSATYHCKMIDVRVFCDLIQLCGGIPEKQGESVNQTSDDVPVY